MSAPPPHWFGRWHARDRAAERHGLHLTRALHDELCRRIREGDGAVVLETYPDGRHLVAVWVGAAGVRWCPVVCSAEGDTLVTFLPGGELKPYRRLLGKGPVPPPTRDSAATKG